MPQEAITPNGKPELCLACPLYDAPGIVPGEGPSAAKIMFVGQNPGGDEGRTKRPFTGGSGRVLTKQCIQAGIDRSQAFVTNVVKCCTPGDRAPTDDEIRICSRFLAAELATVRPNLIIALGNVPLYAITGRTGIMQRRGAVTGVELSYGTQKVFPTIHPAAIMRQQDLWPVVIFDLVRAKAQSEFREIRRRPAQYHLDASVEAHGEYIIRTALERGIADFDLETTNLDPRTSQIICYGIAVDEEQAFVFRNIPANAAFFQRLAGDPRVEIEGQNIETFDIPFCEEKGHVFKGPTFDLLQGWHLVNSHLPKNLGFIMSCTDCDMEFHKDEAKQNLFLYNGKDTLGQKRACMDVRKRLHELNMWDLYRKRVMPIQPILRAMSRRGLRLDTLKAAKWSIGMDLIARKTEAKLREVLGQDLNVHSPKQLMDILYNKLHLPMQFTKDAKTHQMRPTANAEAIKKLCEISNDPFLLAINKVRQLDHTRATYVDVDRDERDFVHGHFGTDTASTGRFNSWDPNWQNIPVELREIYVADDPEHVIITRDWNQIEWQIGMVLSGDPYGLELMSSKADNHSIIAAECFGMSVEDIKKQDKSVEVANDSFRFQSKFIVYGLLYGRGVKTIAAQINRPESWVQGFVNRFWVKFSRYKAYRDECEKFVDQNSYLANPFMRRRWWFTRKVTEVYNFPLQSTAGDMMFKALIDLEPALPKGATLRFTVHDDVGVVAHKSIAKQAYYTMQEVMHQKFHELTEHSSRPEIVKRFYPQGWHCESEGHMGNNWAECKKGNASLEKELLAV